MKRKGEEKNSGVRDKAIRRERERERKRERERQREREREKERHRERESWKESICTGKYLLELRIKNKNKR